LALALGKRFVKAVQAENWAQCQRLGRENNLTFSEVIDYTLTAVAALYAEGQEPARSRVYSAMWQVMEALGDERIADAIEARQDKDG
jgi:hypothetical protein